MKVKVIGVGRFDTDKSKKSGKPFHATVLHISHKETNVLGEAVESVFLSDDLEISCVPNLRPGQTVDLSYNSRGYVVDAEIITEQAPTPSPGQKQASPGQKQASPGQKQASPGQKQASPGQK